MKIMKRFLLALLVATEGLVGLVVLAKPFSFSPSVSAQTPLLTCLSRATCRLDGSSRHLRSPLPPGSQTG